MGREVERGSKEVNQIIRHTQNLQWVPGGTQEPGTQLLSRPSTPGLVDGQQKCHFSVTWHETSILRQFCLSGVYRQTQH